MGSQSGTHTAGSDRGKKSHDQSSHPPGAGRGPPVKGYLYTVCIHTYRYPFVHLDGEHLKIPIGYDRVAP